MRRMEIIYGLKTMDDDGESPELVDLFGEQK